MHSQFHGTFDSHLLSHNHIQWVGSFLLSWITKLFVIYSVIHKRVFTPLQDISTSTIDSVNQTLNSTMTFTENVMPKHKIFCKCYCWILRMIDRRSWRGVKTLLWITRNYRINNKKLCYLMRQLTKYLNSPTVYLGCCNPPIIRLS